MASYVGGGEGEGGEGKEREEGDMHGAFVCGLGVFGGLIVLGM